MKRLVLTIILNIMIGNIIHIIFIGSSMFFDSLRIYILFELILSFSIVITLFIIGLYFIRKRIPSNIIYYIIVSVVTVFSVYISLLLLFALSFKKYDYEHIILYLTMSLIYLLFDFIYWLLFINVNYFLLKNTQRHSPWPREKMIY